MTMDLSKLGKNTHYLGNALQLAYASQLAYEQRRQKVSDALGSDFPRLQMLSSAGAEGFVAAGRKHIVVALRGTDEVRDWIDDLRYTQVSGYGGKVHRGFARQTNCIFVPLQRAVRVLRDNRQTVWVTGHSMGGAMAVLVAKKLAGRRVKPAGVYTMGAPRVLNPAAADAYQLNVYRFVNNEDIVPHLPMRGIFNRYRHVGDLTYFLPSGRISAQGSGFTRMSNRLMNMMRSGVGSVSSAAINDHRIEEYLRKIGINVPHSR